MNCAINFNLKLYTLQPTIT